MEIDGVELEVGTRLVSGASAEENGIYVVNGQWVCTWNGSNASEVLSFLQDTKWDCRIVGKMNAQRLYVKPEDVGWDAEEVVAVGQKLMKDMDGHVSVF